jgi:hypothetical protein
MIVTYNDQVPILIALSLSTSFCGLCIFYTYRDCDPLLGTVYIDKKEKKIFLIYKEIQKGAVAKLIYEEGLPNIGKNAQNF